MSKVATPEGEDRAAIEAITHYIRSPGMQIPMLPQAAQRALTLAREPRSEVWDLSALIEKDQLLAVRFLRAANSALYRRGLPALSVQTALVRIGRVAAIDLLLFAALEPVLFNSKRFAEEMTALSKHSLAVSAACTQLAKVSRTPAVDASMAGLVHDVGAVILLKYVADNFSKFSDAIARGRLGPIIEATHTLAGARLAEVWGLPSLIRAVMTDHHDISDSSAAIVRLVAAADVLAGMAGAGNPFEVIDDRREAIFRNMVPGRDDLVREFTDRVSDLASF